MVWYVLMHQWTTANLASLSQCWRSAKTALAAHSTDASTVHKAPKNWKIKSNQIKSKIKFMAVCLSAAHLSELMALRFRIMWIALMCLTFPSLMSRLRWLHMWPLIGWRVGSGRGWFCRTRQTRGTDRRGRWRRRHDGECLICRPLVVVVRPYLGWLRSFSGLSAL